MANSDEGAMTEPLPRREPGANLPGSRESAREPLWPPDDEDNEVAATEASSSLPNVVPPDMRDLERLLDSLRNWNPGQVGPHDPQSTKPSASESKEDGK